jgi:hypothetical protein
MPAVKKETYNNLIDLYISLEENPELAGDTSELFRRILCDYFFEKETSESKHFEVYFHDFKLPHFISSANNLFEVPFNELRSYIEGSMVNDSLAGTIMLSSSYLKAFYSEHPPSFSKLPEDVQFELIGKVKIKNEKFIQAFQKMIKDREADKKRKILTLIALIIKNVHLKSGRPLNKLQKSAEEIISSIFINTEEVFVASQKQMSDLNDDSKVKELVKSFFKVMQFKEISEIADNYKIELQRYQKRGLKASS